MDVTGLCRALFADDDNALAGLACEEGYSLALPHRLVPLLQKRLLEAGLFEGLKPRPRELFLQYSAWSRANSLRLLQTALSLQRAGVSILLFKGAALARLAFDDFTERPMADLDLLLKPKEWPRARRALQGLGFRELFSGRRPSRGWEQSPFVRGRLTVEVHWEPLPRYLSYTFTPDLVFENTVKVALPAGTFCAPSHEVHALLVACHLQKGDGVQGTRIIQLLDLARLLTLCDRARLQTLARQTDTLCLLNRWGSAARETLSGAPPDWPRYAHQPGPPPGPMSQAVRAAFSHEKPYNRLRSVFELLLMKVARKLHGSGRARYINGRKGTE